MNGASCLTMRTNNDASGEVMVELPEQAAGLRLAKIVKDQLQLCEIVMFADGCSAVDTVLRRAAISGRVEIGGDIQDHFADVLDREQSIIETVALDAKSYGKLKNHWMPCRLVKE